MKTTTTIMFMLGLSAAAAHAGPAPGDMPPPPPPHAAAPQRAEPAPVAGAASKGILENTRGGDARVSNQAELNGTVSRNSAINVATGSNRIDSGSFANASGLPMVIQNSGANVLIQNATVINLQLK